MLPALSLYFTCLSPQGWTAPNNPALGTCPWDLGILSRTPASHEAPTSSTGYTGFLSLRVQSSLFQAFGGSMSHGHLGSLHLSPHGLLEPLSSPEVLGR